MGRQVTVAIDSDGDGNADQTITYTFNHNGLRVATTDASGGTTTTTVHHFDASGGHTGYAQVLEEGVDSNGDGKLDATGGRNGVGYRFDGSGLIG